MTVLYSVLPFLGMLVALIVAHELGHYFTAKLFGVKVLEAGLGYPPRIAPRPRRHSGRRARFTSK